MGPLETLGSFQTVHSVSKCYPVLNKHFTSAGESVTKKTDGGPAEHVICRAFVINLGLMPSALEELSELRVEQKQIPEGPAEKAGT